MSTPTRKSLDSTEQQHSKDNDPLRSPDVPTRAHDRSPYAPKRGHTQTTTETGFIRNEDAPLTRLPRAAQLPPVPGLASGGRRFADSYRSPRSLEPERLVPPDAVMLRRRRWPLIVLIAGLLSTPIAYYFFIGGSAPPAANGPQMASVDPIAVAPLTASKERPATGDGGIRWLRRRTRLCRGSQGDGRTGAENAKLERKRSC